MVKLTVLLSIFYFFSEMVQQYETQYYKVIKNLKKAEIRYYPPSMKIKSNRDNAFSILFSYIITMVVRIASSLWFFRMRKKSWVS